MSFEPYFNLWDFMDGESGMPPLETIIVAILNAAEVLGLRKAMGSIEAHKLADIIGVEGNSVSDIVVMKDGVVYKDK
ncbi:MAG: amidohydrolase family protein [Chitinophagaceae bacterium]